MYILPESTHPSYSKCHSREIIIGNWKLTYHISEFQNQGIIDTFLYQFFTTENYDIAKLKNEKH